MASKKVQDISAAKGRPQSDYAKNYGAWRKGDSWFSEEQNDMDNRKTDKTPDGKDAGQAGRAREMQQKDLMKTMADKAPGGKIPSYQKGGMVKRTGLAKLHAGEKVIPKHNVKRVEKAMRKRSGK